MNLMSEALEAQLLDAMKESLAERCAFLQRNLAAGFKRTVKHTGEVVSYHPALTIAFLPSGRSVVLQSSPSLLQMMFDSDAVTASYQATPAAATMAALDPLASQLVEAFTASQTYQHAVEMKQLVGETIADLFRLKTAPAVTVATKPSVLRHVSRAESLPVDVWETIASYMSVQDLTHLPQVGGIFFEERNGIVWRTLHHRCFGRFSAADLHLVDPWDDFYRDDLIESATKRHRIPISSSSVADSTATNDGGAMSTPGSPGDGHDEDTIEIEMVNYRFKLRVTLLPLIVYSKKSLSAQPSPENFFQKVAPNGSMIIGERRCLVVQASPLSIISLKRGGYSQIEVHTEELATSKGTLHMVTLSTIVSAGVLPSGQTVPSATRDAYLSFSPELRGTVRRIVSQQQQSGV